MKKLYRNHQWADFAEKVKTRDGYSCTKCGKKYAETTLQVHHTVYRAKMKPWEYPLSDCLTLCRGCHAKEHGHIEPTSGWILQGIDDLGDLSGQCEKKGCGNPIRYAHEIYHPQWGAMTVGSTCVEYLTQEDQAISKEVIGLYKDISKFIDGIFWMNGKTKNGYEYKYVTCKYKRINYQIRVYSLNNTYSYQIVQRNRPLDAVAKVKCSSALLALELGYVHLRATNVFGADREILRNVYMSLLKANK